MLKTKRFVLSVKPMNEKIQQFIENSSYKIHTIVQDYAKDEVLVHIRSDEVFSSASVIKVPILIAILHHLQQKGGDLQQVLTIAAENVVDFSVITEQQQTSATLYELLTWMIITSDNTATNECIDFLGTDALNRYFKEIGLNNTVVQRKMMDFKRQQLGFDNETTAKDMQHLFKLIYDGKLLKQKWNEVAIDILCRQRSQESLKRYLVEPVKMAHKTGGLDTVDHDVGIVYTDVTDYFIGVFMTEVTDNEKAKQEIGHISKMVYEHLMIRR